MRAADLDEELRDLQLDRPGKGKSQEQIQRHTVDSNLNPVERSLYILNRGDEIQKLNLIASLPSLLKEDSRIQDVVLPRVVVMLPKAPTEYQLTAAIMLTDMVRQKMNVETLIPTVMNGIQNNDSTVMSAWADALLQILYDLQMGVIGSRILPVVLNMCKADMDINKKMIGVSCTGKIAQHPQISSYTVQKIIWPSIKSIMQDPMYQVRVATCLQMPGIIKGMGSGSDIALTEYFSFCRDDNINVQSAAASVFVQMLPYINLDTAKSQVVPILERFCSLAMSNNDTIVNIVSREIGQICSTLEYLFESSNIDYIIICFDNLAHHGYKMDNSNLLDPHQDILCRQNCASNLSAMATFVNRRSPDHFPKIYAIFHDLCYDPCYLVRKNIAAAIHDIAKAMDIRIIKEEIIVLFRNDSEEVLSNLVPHITEVLILLSKAKLLQFKVVDAAVLKYGKALLQCEAVVSNFNNWRLQTTFYRELECLPVIFPSEFIYSYFVPLIFHKIIKGRYKPTRYQAARTLLVQLKYNNKLQQQVDIRCRISSDICKSSDFYTRIIYVGLCEESLSMFSADYVKQYFFNDLMLLTNDRVANIRIAAVSMLPKLKQMLILPKDRELMNRIETYMRKAEMEETDVDCRDAVRAALGKMDNIKIKERRDRENEQPNAARLKRRNRSGINYRKDK